MYLVPVDWQSDGSTGLQPVHGAGVILLRMTKNRGVQLVQRSIHLQERVSGEILSAYARHPTLKDRSGAAPLFE
jgi:hypothetical protein